MCFLFLFQICWSLRIHQSLFDVDLHSGLVAHQEPTAIGEEGESRHDGRRGRELDHLA